MHSTSIVILTHNELAYTQRCVASIQRHTSEPYEFVFVDNASTDGTIEYLRTIDGATVIANESNLGFGGGCNQGIAASTGDRILLLNNDTVVTPGWLGALHAGLDAAPDRGIVGPRSNHVADVQQVDGVTYDQWSLEGLDSFAAAWVEEHRDHRFECARLIGFCMLVERKVIDRIGGFDVRFGLGNFEDDDLCLRACVAGFSCWVCDDSYVHHFGSRTFSGANIPYKDAFGENFARFIAKWKVPTLVGANGKTCGYQPAGIVSTTTFDPAVHYSPLVAVPDDEAVVSYEHRRLAVLVAADRLRPEETSECLDHCLAVVGPEHDVTLVIRIDPADGRSLELLEAAADRVGDPNLPDIVLLERSDHNDVAAVLGCGLVVTHGRSGAALAGIARQVGVATTTLDGLALCIQAVNPHAAA